MIRALAGAAVAVSAVGALTGCMPVSDYCGGYGARPYDCAALTLDGTPHNVVDAGRTVREMWRPNRPDPTATERANCRSVMTVTYGPNAIANDVWRLKAIQGCNVLEHQLPRWDYATQVIVRW